MGEILRETVSICPECFQNIKATIQVEGNMVTMRKKCEKHGEFMDKLSSDPELYKWQNTWVEPMGSKMDTQPTNYDFEPKKTGCPFDCGMCGNHKSAANFMILDITNRCNLNCPICFANSNKQGRIVEYSFEECVRIMKHFTRQRPYFAPLAQFSGGEPTLHPRIIDILNAAKDLGFPHRMLNTNGIRIAKDYDFTKKFVDTDCGAVYLSFDGLTPESYKKIRGLDISKIKFRALENLRKAKYEGVMLVCTVCKGINDHEVEGILKFGRENNDVVAGIVYQPVSLCGRVAVEDLMRMRYTNSDLIAEINRCTNGQIPPKSFYPLGISNKLTQLLCWFADIPGWAITAHDDCGFATLIQIAPNDKWFPLEHYADVEGLVKWANSVWDMVQKREIPKPSKLLDGVTKLAEQIGLGNLISAIGDFSDKMSDIAYRNAMKAYFIAGSVKYIKNVQPKALLDDKFYTNVMKLVMAPSLRTSKGMLMNGLFFIGSMHFQDAYNMDAARAERCVVHYGALDPMNPEHVLEIPFCTFNTIHRERIEKEWAVAHSKPLDITPEENAKQVEALVKKIETEKPVSN